MLTKGRKRSEISGGPMDGQRYAVSRVISGSPGRADMMVEDKPDLKPGVTTWQSVFLPLS